MKRPDPKRPCVEGVREDLASPDTGQPQAEGQAAESPEEPKSAAAQSNNNNVNNYNIVTSLLNLTKSPVSTSSYHRSETRLLIPH